MGISAHSIDKSIVNSAPKAEMFDFFHVMADHSVEVMAEWDLLLTLDQYSALYTPQAKREKRKAVNEAIKRWKNNIVYYEITESLDTKSDRDIIMAGIDQWKKYTCLKFKENDTNPFRIQFKDGGGCYSKLGMQGEPQPLVLARGCRTEGIIAHEIGHAIGWIHEHMRPDRDDYIFVNKKAIDTVFHMQYEKYSEDVIETYKIPYDYTSLMHYGNGVFKGSLIALDAKYQDQLGQRVGLSFKDIKLANVMYECALKERCTKPTYDYSDGFQMANDYKNKGPCQMWCDSGDINDPLILCSERKTTQPPPQPSLKPTEASEKKDCVDVREDCRLRKQLGHCMTKMKVMIRSCSKTCDFCDKGEEMCMDYDKGCPIMAAAGACKTPGLKKKMEELCKGSCELCHKPPDPCEIQKTMMGDQAASFSAPIYFLGHSIMTTFAFFCFAIVVSTF